MMTKRKTATIDPLLKVAQFISAIFIGSFVGVLLMFFLSVPSWLAIISASFWTASFYWTTSENGSHAI